MSEQTVVIFDLETVPDLSAGRLLIGVNSSESDKEVRTELGKRYARDGQDPQTVFVKVPLHKIVCIGAIYAHRTARAEPWIISRSGVGHTGLRSESQLISGFVESLSEPPSPQLVGFNSSSFDLPVLRYRALALSIPIPVMHRANGKDYWYRFGKDHTDLCDVLSNYGASAKPSLNEIAALCSVPGKPSDTDGSQVESMVNDGRIEDVANYCESDLFSTYLIFIRFGLIVGDVTPNGYRDSMAAFNDFVQDKLEKRPHLERFSKLNTSIEP